MVYGWMDVVSIALNLIFGGGFIITLLTLRAQRKKAGAEAKGAEATAESTELDNVEKAIKIWREMAESLKTELMASNERYDAVAKQVEALRKDVQKLNCTNQKILKLLDKISHDNLESTVAEIKEEIKKGDA
jgi:predicted RNase H-like nuclease (RuvC/YqgF family)